MNNKHDAKYAFYYLLSLIALIFTAFSVGLVIFSIIDKTIPDAVSNYYVNSVDGPLKFAISALLIAGPIFFLISYLISKGLRQGELSKDSGLRRWLTYFILLVSSVIILGVLINVINSFLSGELSSRFILKALSVFVISAITWSFYFYDIRRSNPEQTDLIVRIFFGLTLLITVAAFVAAWFFIESPQTTRARRLDQNLMQNIYSLDLAVSNYYDRHHQLPNSFTDLENDKNINLAKSLLVDPASQAPIVYQKTSERDFALCATWRLSNLSDSTGTTRPVGDTSQEHAAGYQCLPGVLSGTPLTTDKTN
jgi:hypothetical protein